MNETRNPVTSWLESPDGEQWSRDNHRAAHAGEADLPNHIARVQFAPGQDPFWNRHPPQDRYGYRDPVHDARDSWPSLPAREPRAPRTRGRSPR